MQAVKQQERGIFQRLEPSSRGEYLLFLKSSWDAESDAYFCIEVTPVASDTFKMLISERSQLAQIINLRGETGFFAWLNNTQIIAGRISLQALKEETHLAIPGFLAAQGQVQSWSLAKQASPSLRLRT